MFDEEYIIYLLQMEQKILLVLNLTFLWWQDKE